jgi:hypothetical protein
MKSLIKKRFCKLFDLLRKRISTRFDRHLKLNYDQETQQQIISLVKNCVLGKTGKPGAAEPAAVLTFLSRESPPPPLHYSVSPPLFPRSQRRHIGDGERKHSATIDPMKLIRRLSKAPIEEEEIHLFNSQIVDGWSEP